MGFLNSCITKVFNNFHRSYEMVIMALYGDKNDDIPVQMGVYSFMHGLRTHDIWIPKVITQINIFFKCVKSLFLVHKKAN